MFNYFNKNNFFFNYNLGSKTWFGTGGKCFCFITVDSKRTISIILKYFKRVFPVFIVGAGSNLIVRDGGINGIVIKLGKSFSQIKLYKKEIVLNNKIKNNLYSAAVEAGIEPNIIIEFARIYGFEIDFQRDLRKDDTFEIYYERLVDNEGVVRDTGKIIYASMNVNNRDISLYAFEEKNEIGYFDVSGKSIVKSLMKTPINGARLSSSFGMRKHPIPSPIGTRGG